MEKVLYSAGDPTAKKGCSGTTDVWLGVDYNYLRARVQIILDLYGSLGVMLPAGASGRVRVDLASVVLRKNSIQR